MKLVAFIITCLMAVSGSAQVQAKLGMGKAYSISPALATSVAAGIPYGGNITVNCSVRNSGNATFNGSIDLVRAVKSGSLQSSNFIVKTFSVSLPAGDSIAVSFTDSITPASYKQNGNGNTVVVWPISSGIITSDSLLTEPVYVNPSTFIKEFSKTDMLVYPNPAGDVLFIKPETGIEYKTIMVYDMQLKLILEKPFNERLDVNDLPPGVYHIKISTRGGAVYSTLFTKAD